MRKAKKRKEHTANTTTRARPQRIVLRTSAVQGIRVSSRRRTFKLFSRPHGSDMHGGAWRWPPGRNALVCLPSKLRTKRSQLSWRGPDVRCVERALPRVIEVVRQKFNVGTRTSLPSCWPGLVGWVHNAKFGVSRVETQPQQQRKYS